MWARSGRELFYRKDDKMMAVDVQTETTFHAGSPRVLFEGKFARVPWGEADYDVSADGQRFLMIKEATTGSPVAATSGAMIIAFNWLEELKRLVPTK